MIAPAIAFGLLLTIVLTLVRLFAGPTLYDRVLAANVLLWQAALVVAAVMSTTARSDGIFVAFALILGAFVLNIATMKFFRMHTFQTRMASVRDEER